MKPSARSIHPEPHFSQRSNWLRAAVLGANDGLISTASLMTGVAAAQPGFNTLLLTGIAALTGGAVSMAAGEYVSVSSQADTEKADKLIEARELALNPDAELEELAGIYQQRGLSAELAREVAEQLTAHDALDAHVRDEIGITETSSANPMQAALASAAAFVSGAALPLRGCCLPWWFPPCLAWPCLVLLRPSWAAPSPCPPCCGSCSGGCWRWG